MAKCTPKVDIREVKVIETIETQTGITLELSNVECHVLARLLGCIAGPYDTKDPTLLRSIASGLWGELVAAGYGTAAHVKDSRSWFKNGHSYLVADDNARPSDITPGPL